MSVQMKVNGDAEAAARRNMNDAEAVAHEKMHAVGEGEGEASTQAESASMQEGVDSSAARMETVPKTRTFVLRTMRQECFFECFITDYKDADFELKLKNVGTHLRARIQALEDIVVGTLKTLVEAVACLSTLLLAPPLALAEKISKGSANRFVKFFEIIGPQDHFNVLKAQGLGTLYSVYAFASPERAIKAGVKSERIGTSLTSNNKDNWGKEYTGTRNYALSSSYYAWGDKYKA